MRIGRKELHFRNHTDQGVWVCIMFYSPDACGGDYGSWGTRGWWFMNPNQEACVLDTDDDYAGYYAESAGGDVWSGPYGPVYVPRAHSTPAWTSATTVRRRASSVCD